MRQYIGQYIVETERARIRRDRFVALVWLDGELLFVVMGSTEHGVYDAAYGYVVQCRDAAAAD